MQQQNALYALIIGIDATASDFGNSPEDVIQAVRTTDLETWPFFAKIRSILAKSIEKCGVKTTAHEYGLPLSLLNKIQNSECKANLKLKVNLNLKKLGRVTPKIKQKIISMYTEGYTVDDIALVNGTTEDEIQKIWITTFSQEYYNRKEAGRERRKKRRIDEVAAVVQQTRATTDPDHTDYSFIPPDLIDLV